MPMISLKQEKEKGLEKKPEEQDLHYFLYLFPFCRPLPFSEFLFISVIFELCIGE